MVVTIGLLATLLAAALGHITTMQTVTHDLNDQYVPRTEFTSKMTAVRERQDLLIEQLDLRLSRIEASIEKLVDKEG